MGQIVSTDRDAPPQTKRELFRFYVCISVKRRYLLVFSGAANVIIFLVFRPGVSRKRDVYRRIPFFSSKTAFETTRRDVLIFLYLSISPVKMQGFDVKPAHKYITTSRGIVLKIGHFVIHPRKTLVFYRRKREISPPGGGQSRANLTPHDS